MYDGLLFCVLMYLIECKHDGKLHPFTLKEILGGRTPYSMALETFGEETLKTIQLRSIELGRVNLTPKLIRFNHIQ